MCPLVAVVTSYQLCFACLIGQGFRKRKIITHIVSFVNGIHKRKNYKSRGIFVFVKNDTLSINIGVILFFFEVINLCMFLLNIAFVFGKTTLQTYHGGFGR
jgi:hypothetical protein